MPKPSIILRDMDLEEMQGFLQAEGMPAYRARQLFLWLFHKMENDPDKMSDLPAAMRDMLNNETELELLTAHGNNPANISDTKKILFKLNDGRFVETVLIYNEGRRTVCVSSQVGCALGCLFCQTGKMGAVRNLSSGEISEQLRYMMLHSAEPVTNVVFMGMGEPFLNYDNVIKAAKIMNHEAGFNISARRITLSTAGIIPRIREFADLKSQFKLAISLNSPFQNERRQIMPVTKKYPLDELLDAAKYYVNTAAKRITFEYVLLDGINMSMKHGKALIKILKNINCKLNLIPFNETESEYKRPSDDKVRQFESLMRYAPFPVTVRWSGGRDTQAACGQLYYHVSKKDQL